MRQLTQTREDNCWQTCAAMLLDREPGSLPDQSSLGDGYMQAFRAYLFNHHDMTYVEVGPERFSEVDQQGVFHMMIGETVRMTPDHDVWHAIVGTSGKPFWDVHPSRAGLTKIVKYGVLAPLPETWRMEWNRRKREGEVSAVCVCPACQENAVA